MAGNHGRPEARVPGRGAFPYVRGQSVKYPDQHNAILTLIKVGNIKTIEEVKFPNFKSKIISLMEMPNCCQQKPPFNEIKEEVFQYFICISTNFKNGEQSFYIIHESIANKIINDGKNIIDYLEIELGLKLPKKKV